MTATRGHKSTRKTTKRETKSEHETEEGEKAKFLGLHPFGPLQPPTPLGFPPFRAHPFIPPPFGDPLFLGFPTILVPTLLGEPLFGPFFFWTNTFLDETVI